MFAKLFESEKYGQILAKQDTDGDSCPEVRFYVEPEGFGVCSIALSWPDDDSGWEKSDKVFDMLDKEFAEQVSAGIFEQLSGLVSG